MLKRKTKKKKTKFVIEINWLYNTTMLMLKMQWLRTRTLQLVIKSIYYLRNSLC